MYTKQIVLGLEYLHKNDIAHRDVKGGNVLVTDNGGVKLADFGASKQRTAGVDSMGTAYRSLKGTPCFMAPEVIQQQGYGNGADIWSVGCTVIEMATGSPPWSEKRDSHTIMFNIVTSSGPPALPNQLSSSGRDFLKRCFERNPAFRATAAELLQHPFLKNVKTGPPRGDCQGHGYGVNPFRRIGVIAYGHQQASSGACTECPCPPHSPPLKPHNTSSARSSVLSEPKFHNLLSELRDVLHKRRVSIRSGEQENSAKTAESSFMDYKQKPGTCQYGSKSRDNEVRSKYRCGALTPNELTSAGPSARNTGIECREEAPTRTPANVGLVAKPRYDLSRSHTAPVMRNRGLEDGMAPVIKELAAKFVNPS